MAWWGVRGGGVGKSGCRRKVGAGMFQAGEQGESSGCQGELGAVSGVKEERPRGTDFSSASLHYPCLESVASSHHTTDAGSQGPVLLVGRCPTKEMTHFGIEDMALT